MELRDRPPRDLEVPPRHALPPGALLPELAPGVVAKTDLQGGLALDHHGVLSRGRLRRAIEGPVRAPAAFRERPMHLLHSLDLDAVGRARDALELRVAHRRRGGEPLLLHRNARLYEEEGPQHLSRGENRKRSRARFGGTFAGTLLSERGGYECCLAKHELSTSMSTPRLFRNFRNFRAKKIVHGKEGTNEIPDRPPASSGQSSRPLKSSSSSP